MLGRWINTSNAISLPIQTARQYKCWFALKPIYDAVGVLSVLIATYQAVSNFG